MKIWLNIALVILIIAFGSVELFQIYSIPIIEKEIINLQGEKLKAVAATAALNIDGDIYKTLDFRKENVTDRKIFQLIRQQLLSIKSTLMFKEDIYTLNVSNDSEAVFGVMTNKKIFSGEFLHISNVTAKEAYKGIMRNKQCTYTGIYEDQYGKWISGMAPILDSDNNVVGIVQADHKAAIINDALNGIEQGILIFKFVALFIIALLSIFMAKMITQPILRVTETIKRIAEGNYEYHGKIKASAELKQLVESTDLMRRTIVAQQEKIFDTIRKLQKMNANLIKAKDKAEASDNIKSEFLAMVSHEIRTPINVLLSYSGLIKDELNEEQLEQNEFIFIAIQKAGWRLIRTVDLIVTTADIQTGSYEVNKKEQNLHEILASIYVSCKPFTADKAFEFSFENNAENSLVVADEYTLQQIFTNLIDNAIKFTEDGYVHVNLFRNEDDNLVVEISDTGIGISDEYKEKIFNVFSQEQQGYTRKFEGNGLGLALVNKSCEINNAILTYESTKGSGSTFRVTFVGDNKKLHLG